MQLDVADLSHLSQVISQATAPAFLLGAVAGFLTFLVDRRVQQPPNVAGECVERHHLSPGATPALADGRVLAAPGTLLEGGERRLAGSGVDRAVDVPQRGSHGLTV